MRTCPNWGRSPSRHTADVDTYRPIAAVVRGSRRAAGSGKRAMFRAEIRLLWIGTPPALSFAEVNKNNVSEWRRSHLFRTHGFRRGSAALRPHPVGRAERHLQGALERPSRHEPVLRLSYASYVGKPRVLKKAGAKGGLSLRKHPKMFAITFHSCPLALVINSKSSVSSSWSAGNTRPKTFSSTIMMPPPCSGAYQSVSASPRPDTTG
jgi:hypothetical protein